MGWKTRHDETREPRPTVWLQPLRTETEGGTAIQTTTGRRKEHHKRWRGKAQPHCSWWRPGNNMLWGISVIALLCPQTLSENSYPLNFCGSNALGSTAREGLCKRVPAVAKAAEASGRVGRWSQQQRSKLVPGWPRAEETSLSFSEVLEGGVLGEEARVQTLLFYHRGLPCSTPMDHEWRAM